MFGVATGFLPLGMVVMGGLTGAFGIGAAALLAATIAHIAGVLMLCLPVLWEMDRPVSSDPSPIPAQ